MTEQQPTTGATDEQTRAIRGVIDWAISQSGVTVRGDWTNALAQLIVAEVVPPGYVIAPATRVLDAADVAALRHLVTDHKLVQTVVRQALRDTTTADLARIDRFLGAQP